MPINSFTDYPMNWKPNSAELKSPLYTSIAEKLESDIKSGVLTPGTKLPPQRELADYLNVNLSTISRAFRLCTQKGLICATIGNGTFVSSDAGLNTYLLKEDSFPQIIEMGAVFPESEPYDEITEQIKRMLIEPHFGKLFDYGRPEGTFWQKEAAAKLLKKAGYDANPQNILLTSGGQNTLAAILASLFKPGDRIGTDPVTFPGIKTAASMLGIQLIPIKQENNEIARDGLLFACKNENIKGLYLIPDYQNPTTHTMSGSTRKTIADIARSNNLIVIEDAALSLMAENIPAPIAAYAPKNTLYVSSLSKVIAPGIRLAYVATPTIYTKKLSEALYNINISVSPMMAELATRLIISGTADKIVERHRVYTKTQNQIVNSYISGYPVLGEPECMFRWLILPERFTGESFEAEAFRAGVRVYAAERFTVGKAKPIRAVRLAVTASGSSTKLEEALNIIRNILENDEGYALY
ncbi:MAG TPA: PLP-dependent aminotransferase family protein [Syntrophomonadaceae bacterium]|nr:PLP-dependent aminotransferase family protein [Syntrophomonadaceae bacterium]